MGGLLSFSSKSTKLCDGLLSDSDDFMITISIYTIIKLEEKHMSSILEYLQYMHPVLSYAHSGTIYLLYNPKNKPPFLRSNVANEIISYISSELSIWMVKNGLPDPRMLDVDITIVSYKTAVQDILNIIKTNKYTGHLYGVQELNEVIIKDHFALVA